MKILLIIPIFISCVLSSCREDYNSNSVAERVTCEFRSKISNDGIINIPTKAIGDRQILYRFESKDPADLIEGRSLENSSLLLDLKRGATYDGKFFYAGDINKDTVSVKDRDVYGFNKTYNITESFSEKVLLSRKIGMFTAKAGKIPKSSVVQTDIMAYRQFDWITSAIFYDPKNPSTFSVLKSTLNTGDSCFVYGIADKAETILIHVALVRNGKVMKEGGYRYAVKENINHIVTYNVNNADTEFGDFDIAITEEWFDPEKESQQIGK